MGPARFHCATLLLVERSRPPHVFYGERRPATSKNNCNNTVRQPGIEPGSTAWKATMLTTTPLSLPDARQA